MTGQKQQSARPRSRVERASRTSRRLTRWPVARSCGADCELLADSHDSASQILAIRRSKLCKPRSLVYAVALSEREPQGHACSRRITSQRNRRLQLRATCVSRRIDYAAVDVQRAGAGRRRERSVPDEHVLRRAAAGLVRTSPQLLDRVSRGDAGVHRRRARDDRRARRERLRRREPRRRARGRSTSTFATCAKTPSSCASRC